MRIQGRLPLHDAAFARWILKKTPPLPRSLPWPPTVGWPSMGYHRATWTRRSFGRNSPSWMLTRWPDPCRTLTLKILKRETPAVDPRTATGRRPDLSDLDDGAMGSFVVKIPLTARNPATVDDAYEKHITRRESDLIVRRLRAVSWVACPLAVVAISFWMAGPAVAELLGGPAVSAWKGLAVFVLAEALGGCLIAMGISSWLDLRVSGFFLVARELSRYTVLQGRRDEEFLQALRVLRPGLFDTSATAGLPRRFTVCFDKEGAMLVGGRTQPFVVASFHWLHVRQILAEPPVRGRPFKRGSGQRVVLLIRHGGTHVRLAFPLERAKVAWTTRTFLESDPVKAALALLQGMRDLSSIEGPGISRQGMRKMTPESEERMHLLLRQDAVLEGTDYENAALEYEARQRPALAPAASAFLRNRRLRSTAGWSSWRSSARPARGSS